MDYEFHQIKLGSSTIYLLEIFENFNPENYFDLLTEREMERYFSFSHLKRKKEFVATRILKHNIFGFQEIKYESHGAPYLNQHDFISISHAENLVGIAHNSKFGIGFDLEKIHPKVLKIYHKFLNQSELLLFDLENTEDLIISWSLKETLYKLSGRKKLSFQEELLLLERGSTNFIGKIINQDDFVLVNLEYIRFKDYIITINCSERIYKPK